MAPYVGAPEIKARRLVLAVEYHGQIGNPGYYRWRKEYGGLRVNHLKRLKALELENSRLRTVVADQALALVILRETAGKTD